VTRTTLAAVFRGPGLPLDLREIPIPDVSGPSVLVEVLACTLCGSDLHTVHGRRAVPVPTILGHEILGRVAAFGPEASRRDAAGHALREGDRVTWGVVANCGDCFYCLRGLPQKCARQVKYGHEPLRPGLELTGGLAGHCLLVPGTTVLRVPDALPDATACPVNCATATVAAALEAAGPIGGRRALVMGSGMLGVTATGWARAHGAESVIACDVSSDRLALARRFGATHVATPEGLASIALDGTGGYGVDVALEMTGAAESIEAVLPLVRPGGVVVLVGSVFPTRPVPIAPEQIVRRCLTVRGIHNYAPGHLRAALDFLAAHLPLPFGDLVADWQPLGGIEQVLASPGSPDRLRLGIRPGR
jgi:alcohol dehydrogenase